MGQTANFDLDYPELGDIPDVPADMKELADDVDAVLTTIDGRVGDLEDAVGGDTGWITLADRAAALAAGFSEAPNWQFQASSGVCVYYRKVGHWVHLRFQRIARINTAISAGTDGNMSNTAVVDALPAALRPTHGQTLGMYSTGRPCFFNIGPTSILIVASTPGSTINVGELVSISGSYLVD